MLKTRHDRQRTETMFAIMVSALMTTVGATAFAQSSSPAAETAAPAAEMKSEAATASPAAPEAKPAETVQQASKDATAEPAKEMAKETAKETERAKETPAASSPPVAAEPPAVAETGKDTGAAKAAAVSPANQPVADKLRDMLGNKALKRFDRKQERAAVETIYAARSYAPLWSDGGKMTARARDAIARLKKADTDGLDPADYATPDLASATTPEALAEGDLKLTETLLTYARHAENGRIHWSRVSADIFFPDHASDPMEVLANLAGANDINAVMDAFHPEHEGYKALKAKLAELRAAKTDPQADPVASGPALKFVKKQMMEDDRVPRLRERLKLDGAADDKRYDSKLADAVRKFQSANDIKATGVLDDATVKALNGPTRDRQIDIVLYNMERWRWLPRHLGEPKLGDAYVILNIPDFTLKVMQHGKMVWTTRVVTGKPGKTATPMLTETMKFITVNPTWNVPPSIVYNEYLPALQQDPTVLERMGLRLSQNRDGSVHISQPPGAGNALGRIRFNFPNKFLVYQHDTPDKHLFAHDSRAYSHGCMRVQYPDKYAEALLGIALPQEKYTAERIQRMYGTSEQNINFPTPIPVHITYQTAFVDDSGKLEMRRDIYGRDARTQAVMRGDERRMADVAVEHAQPNYSRPSVQLPNRVAFGDGGGASFFERLFGGGAPPEPEPRRRRRPAR
jgi:murein L,D-transpeptidase YcbB/YkuD